jgi:hypothetical protein
MAKRLYNTGKSASLPGGRITEKFKADLKEWSAQLNISQSGLLERAFYSYITNHDSFIHCPHCDAAIAPSDYQLPRGFLEGVCKTCEKEYSILLQE